MGRAGRGEQRLPFSGTECSGGRGAPFQHMYGEAADITVGSPSANAALFALLESGGFDFDQLIDERGYAWLHVSWCRTNRRQVLHL